MYKNGIRNYCSHGREENCSVSYFILFETKFSKLTHACLFKRREEFKNSYIDICRRTSNASVKSAINSVVNIPWSTILRVVLTWVVYNFEYIFRLEKLMYESRLLYITMYLHFCRFSLKVVLIYDGRNCTKKLCFCK